jgi:hypothetical protein
MGVTVGLIAAAIGVALAAVWCCGGSLPAVLYPKGSTPRNCVVVPQRVLGDLMREWAQRVVAQRYAVCLVVLTVFVALAAGGCPQLEVDRGSPAKWVPSGSLLQQRIYDWEDNVDNSVADGTWGFIMIAPDVGGNMLDDPKRWLDATLRVLKRVYATAVIEAEDEEGNALELGWKDFCFSINHPLLVDEIVVGGTQISTGTQGKCRRREPNLILTVPPPRRRRDPNPRAPGPARVRPGD